jgi:carbon storage regulator CsrA
MLVLARREGEKIIFPNLGITLEVVRVKGNTARLGVRAPEDVTVLRYELFERDVERGLQELSDQGRRFKDIPHFIRNRVHAASLGLHLLRKQMERGMVEEATANYEKVLKTFEELEKLASLFEAPSPTAAPRGAAPVSPPSRRALVVEDDANECELLAGFLRLSGFQVATAGDGTDALGYLSSHELPDVVLVDMFMPRCDGPTVVDAIRQNPHLGQVKLFALSGTSPASLGVPTGPTGIDRWFPKPINPEVLVREIDAALTPAACA